MSKPDRGSASLRQGRCALPEHTYFVTTRTRGVALSSPEDRDLVQEALAFTHASGWWEIYGYVVMSDHLHVIAKLGDSKGLPDIVASIKKWSARRINALHGMSGNLWQEGYQEKEVRGERPYLAILAYVVQNPVRAGLAAVPGEYVWCWVPGWYDAAIFGTTTRPSGSGEPSHST